MIGSLVIYALMMGTVVYLLATLGEEATHNTSTYRQLESLSKFTRNCGGTVRITATIIITNPCQLTI